MRYLVRTLMVLVFIPVATILMFGLGLTIFLTILQVPIWFIWKGEFLEDDDTAMAWYFYNVVGSAEDFWEKMLKWSRE